MSLHKAHTVICDGCLVHFEGNAMPRPLRKAAKEAGWKVGKKKDYCPTCKDGLTDAPKADVPRET